MTIRPLFATMLVALVCACAYPARKETPMAQAAPQPTTPAETPSWMNSRDYAMGAPLPPMEAGRKVNEQDCTKPIDLKGGNLRCR